MKKILLLVLIISSMLFSAIRNQIPLPASQLSTDNNGSKSAIEAYRDGVGIYTVKAQGNDDLDNKEMNNLVFKYGEAAGDSNTNLKEYVLEHGDSSEKESASKLGKFEPFVPLAGSSCDDNNVKTINDRYVNGVCVGVDVEGKFCNDNNAQTIYDIYVNGICSGLNVENEPCDDNNIETINDKYTDGICVGLNVEGLPCDDNDVETIYDTYINGTCEGSNVQGKSCDDHDIRTINDKYVNGECVGLNVEGLDCDDNNQKTIEDKYTNGFCIGINVEGLDCDDNNTQTINDKYLDGSCVGTNVEGQVCNDNNAKTIDDKYTDGICVGTNVEGQTCNDSNAQTINDKYTDGICAGTNVEGQTCNDNNAQTINDKYISGICVGTNVEGQTCNDSNAKTINDKYVNGICVGTNVEGQACNDNNAKTINDKYANGICVGLMPKSCKELYQSGATTSGIYTIDLDGPGSAYSQRTAYCNMGKVDGVNGWTLLYSFSDGNNTNLNGYFGTNIDTIAELNSAGMSHYVTHFNDRVSYASTVKPNYLSFFYGSAPIGYIGFKTPANASRISIEWGNFYGGNSRITKNGATLRTISAIGNETYNFASIVGDDIKIDENGITNIGKIWSY